MKKTRLANANETVAEARGNMVQVQDVFDASTEFTVPENLAGKKSGRLGRMTWEFETADTINRNRRIYPAAVFDEAVKELAARVERNVVFGNLDHPSLSDPDSAHIRLSESSHKIVSVEMKSRTRVRVVADILDNDNGRQLVSVLAVGGNPGVSQRGIAIWREPTPEERERFQIPDSSFVDVAEYLRLITYDVVGEPGFADAQGARVTEHSGSDQGAQAMTLEELKAKHPDVYNQIASAGEAKGREAARAEAQSAFEAQKKAAVDEAVKAANEASAAKIADQTKAAAKAMEALAAIKPIMVDLGIVNERITDADAARKIAEAEATAKAAAIENANLKEQLDAQKKQIDALGRTARIRAGLEAIKAKHDGHPAMDHVLKRIAKLEIEDHDKALAAAAEEFAYLESINPSLIGTRPKPAVENDLLAGLLSANADLPAGKPANENQPAGTSAINAAIRAGHSLGF